MRGESREVIGGQIGGEGEMGLLLIMCPKETGYLNATEGGDLNS